jgi:hypothetical protein
MAIALANGGVSADSHSSCLVGTVGSEDLMCLFFMIFAGEAAGLAGLCRDHHSAHHQLHNQLH